jgi:hypothetical protein
LESSAYQHTLLLLEHSVPYLETFLGNL